MSLKTYVSEELLNWHSLSLIVEICIHIVLPELTGASKAKKNDSKFSPKTKGEEALYLTFPVIFIVLSAMFILWL